MKTIALRFGDNLAPACGTILAHQEYIKKDGFVWYGKFGKAISTRVAEEISKNKPFKVLLIRSAKTERYWATVEEISFSTPSINNIPSYYTDLRYLIKCWFKVVSFEKAPKDVMSKCIVISSRTPLSEVSRSSMSPYFIIDYCEEM